MLIGDIFTHKLEIIIFARGYLKDTKSEKVLL